jgi:hypothetical protein
MCVCVCVCVSHTHTHQRLLRVLSGAKNGDIKGLGFRFYFLFFYTPSDIKADLVATRVANVLLISC